MIGDELHKKLGGLDKYVILATVEAKKYYKTNLDIVSYFVKKRKTPGVYVTLNKPYAVILEDLKKRGIESKMILFIDAVTRTTMQKPQKTGGCLFIGNPENLSDLSLATDQAVRALPFKEKFILFDSLNTLLVYNNINMVIRFIHFLISKMRIWKVVGIIISLEKSDKELIDKLSQFCDVTIKM